MPRMTSRLGGALLVALAAVGSVPRAGRAQAPVSKEGVETARTAFLADLAVMHDKFIGLAQAFPEDKYTWRPMAGVRSVSEVLMLIAFEHYGWAPPSLGGTSANLGSREEANKLRTLTSKAEIIEHLNKSYAYAREQVQAADPMTLTAPRQFVGQDHNVVEITEFIAGDMHEHLGQLIAYARMNQIVPPWSK
jgi:DinB superfamily